MRVDQDATLLASFDVDRTICMGEVAKVDSTSRGNVFDRAQYSETVLRACLAQRGYVAKPAT